MIGIWSSLSFVLSLFPTQSVLVSPKPVSMCLYGELKGLVCSVPVQQTIYLTNNTQKSQNVFRLRLHANWNVRAWRRNIWKSGSHSPHRHLAKWAQFAPHYNIVPDISGIQNRRFMNRVMFHCCLWRGTLCATWWCWLLLPTVARGTGCSCRPVNSVILYWKWHVLLAHIAPRLSPLHCRF